MQKNNIIFGGSKRHLHCQKVGVLVCFALSVLIWPTIHAYDTGQKVLATIEIASSIVSDNFDHDHGHSHDDEDLPEQPAPNHSHVHDPADHSHEVPIVLAALNHRTGFPPSENLVLYLSSKKLGAVFDLERPPRS